ncbi:MAG: hypothetical protein IANPNBLG_00239 [Bryobacteraceae bacterium]|nr:hypothetical protein [Bryobacteraceae bacterium]
MRRHIMHREPVDADIPPLVAILPVRDFRHHLIGGVHEIESRIEIATHRLEQLRPLQLVSGINQRSVNVDVVPDDAALIVLAVFIYVDPFGEPLVYPPDQRGVRIEFVELRESRTDHPPVVRRVHAPMKQTPGGGLQVRLKERFNLAAAMHPRNVGRRARAPHGKRRVGRRVEVRDRQIDVAVRRLRARGEADCKLQPLHHERILVELRARVMIGRAEGVRNARRRARVNKAEVVGDASVIGVRGVGDLELEKPLHAFVMPFDGDCFQVRSRIVGLRGRLPRHAGRGYSGHPGSSRGLHGSTHYYDVIQ